jgi:hypothetical protein
MEPAMDKKLVKDLMVPLEEYAVVDEEDTLLDALLALDEAQKKLPPGRQPYRAVLVRGKKGDVVGKLGQLVFLNALEPKYSVLGDLGKLARAGVSPELVSSMMEHFRFLQDSLPDLCRRASMVKVKDVMHPTKESIDENAPLSEAIHRMVLGQTLSILVTRGSDPVGLIRLSELFDVIADNMKSQGA